MKSVCEKHQQAYESECPYCESPMVGMWWTGPTELLVSNEALEKAGYDPMPVGLAPNDHIHMFGTWTDRCSVCGIIGAEMLQREAAK